MTTGLNMDFDKRVVIAPGDMHWVQSSLAGVERKMLEREGAESGRATTIVRYAPGSAFSSHRHDGGEEFIVLDGVFSDQHGDFGPGMYIRNPIGSEHQPSSKDGCTIFVKLSQFEPEDQNFVRLDTASGTWLPGPAEGLTVLPLHEFGPERIALVKWQPGTRFLEHAHPGAEEILVLDGVFEDEFGSYGQATWLRNPPESRHTPFSRKGCTIYVKTGHHLP